MSNKLVDSTSPYLLQHAENPVEWYPWGPEALAAAKELDKPIFLSIGYAACHWCHVMAHESFEDPETAALMNKHFVSIKVDREERPDIDSLYMEAVVAMTGQGGWPMSLFLTPEGRPFYGGTYYPPTRRFNMPAFGEILRTIADKWSNDREGLLQVSDELTDRISAVPKLPPRDGDLDVRLFDQAAEVLFRSYDWTLGGWGQAPKFPQPMTIEFLLRRYAREKDKLALDMVTHALAAMAAGGIYDQLGGGFARYAVDDKWLVPHFEKMLYDNAQLARAYIQCWQVTGDPQLLKIAEETFAFMLREMRDPRGGFYSSYDADSEGEEGKYYVWSVDEIRQVIEDPQVADLVIAAYGATEEGNYEGHNILHRAADHGALAKQFSLDSADIEARLAIGRKALLEARAERVPPGLDNKVLTAWNGLTLIALAEAARASHNEEYLAAAQQLAEFLLSSLVVDGRLLRSWRKGEARYTAYLEDHAALGLGLLALYQADFDPRWYREAKRQADEIVEAFTDPQGGFFDTRHDHEQLIARPKSIQDSPTPSGNTLAVTLLLKIGAYEGESRYIEPAESALRSMAKTAAQHPAAFAGWLNALDFAIGPQLQLAIAGSPSDPNFKELSSRADTLFIPNLVVAGGEPGEEGQPMLMADRTLREGVPTAYLCQGFTCQLPTTKVDELLRQMDEALTPPE
ncbi:MAG: thioredoxin domain-containing protein [Chloroflexi bacterium]|nr:thioredoxin domain-containing protein [Chloroflexota bacterium]